MSQEHNTRCRKVRDFNGDLIKLDLELKQEFKDKKYDLYYVCKIVKDGDKEKRIRLYAETFTPEQVDKFYKDPSFYITEIHI